MTNVIAGKSLEQIKAKRKELRDKIKAQEKKIANGGDVIFGHTPCYQRIALLKAELKGLNWVLKK